MLSHLGERMDGPGSWANGGLKLIKFSESAAALLQAEPLAALVWILPNDMYSQARRRQDSHWPAGVSADAMSGKGVSARICLSPWVARLRKEHRQLFRRMTHSHGQADRRAGVPDGRAAAKEQ